MSGLAPDLRDHLEALRRAGQLIELTKPVDPATEAGRLIAELEAERRCGLFRSVRGSDFSLVFNLLGSRELMGLALGVQPASVTEAFDRQLDERMATVEVAPEEAPVREVVWREDEADLTRLPLITHAEHDAAPYVTAGVAMAVDPETGLRNASFNRMMLIGPRESGIRMMAPQQLGLIHQKAEAANEDLPVAVAIGLHPLYLIAAATSLPFGEDELELAGALLGSPVPMVAGVTVPFPVPAAAEFVIEGVVPAGVREPEGPFGEFMQYYVPEGPNHRFRVTAISHRRDAIFNTMNAASPEDVGLLGISREVAVLRAARATGARVTGVRLASKSIMVAFVAIEPRYDGEGKAVGLAALAAYRWLKYVVVVDSDVDIDDPDDVWWAAATRSEASRGVTAISDVGGFPRDSHGLHRSKLVLDATAPLNGRDSYRRKRPPGQGKLSLDDFR
jgi:UbiD family decarboxylase